MQLLGKDEIWSQLKKEEDLFILDTDEKNGADPAISSQTGGEAQDEKMNNRRNTEPSESEEIRRNPRTAEAPG